MRILVTGAAGFLGYAMAALLVKHGHEVIGLTRSGTSPLPRAWRASKATCSHPGPCPGRLVLASTCTVYSSQAEQPLSESAAVAPTSPYASSKLAAGQAAADLAATGAIGAISLRAFSVAGALPEHPDRDTTRLIPQLLAVQQGRAPELVINGAGSAVRDFVHVTDMATAFVLALHACQPGHWRAYNVGSGHPSTVHEVIATAEAVTGRPVPRRHAAAAHEPAMLLADSTRIRSELGWRPRKSRLPEIISDAWNALTSN